MTRPMGEPPRTPAFLVSLLLAVALVLGAASPAHAFKFRVRGYGHGLGMSQYGAEGFAQHGYSYEQILRHYYGNAGKDSKTTVSGLQSEPARDVLLDEAAGSGDAAYTRSSWRLRPGHAGTNLAVYQAGGVITLFADGSTSFAASGSNLIVTDAQGKTRTYSDTVARPVAVWGASGNPRLTQVVEPTGHYNHEYVRFRGELRLATSNGKVKLENRVSMRDYLYGVVPRESPAWFHMEALKAQAVAARGYSYTSSRSVLFTDTRDQVYGGHSRGVDRSKPTAHEHARTSAAVDATFGRVVKYAGTPVRTFFMSTSGGHTENNENVWGGTALPYIRGVPDPYEVSSGATYHVWQEYDHDAATVRARLVNAGILSSRLPATISSMQVTKRGVSGRVMEVTIRGTDGSSRTFSGSTDMDRFRNALGSRPPGYTASDRWWYVNPKTGTRIAGSDRYATSVAASQRVFSSPSHVIVAGGGSPADALAAAGLAGAAGGAPILLTEPGRLTPVVANEIRRLSPARVYVVGGSSAVSQSVVSELHALPGLGGASAVKRLGGIDRYETARIVAEEIKWWRGSSSRALVVNGESLVDAVAAAGFVYQYKLPVILTTSHSLPAPSAAAVSSLGVSTSLVVGGVGAVSDAVMQGLPGASRIAAGADRYETAGILADYLVAHEGFNWGSAYVVSGSSMVDALSAGPVAGHNRNPMLFVREWAREPATFDRLNTRRNSIFRIHVVGGEASIPGWQQGQIDELLE